MFQCIHCPPIFEVHFPFSFLKRTVKPVPQSPGHKFLIIITTLFLSSEKIGSEKQYQFLSLAKLKPSRELFHLKVANFSFCSSIDLMSAFVKHLLSAKVLDEIVV